MVCQHVKPRCHVFGWVTPAAACPQHEGATQLIVEAWQAATVQTHLLVAQECLPKLAACVGHPSQAQQSVRLQRGSRLRGQGCLCQLFCLQTRHGTNRRCYTRGQRLLDHKRPTRGTRILPWSSTTGKAELCMPGSLPAMSDEQVRNHSKEASRRQRKARGLFSSRGNRGVPPSTLCHGNRQAGVPLPAGVPPDNPAAMPQGQVGSTPDVLQTWAA